MIRGVILEWNSKLKRKQLKILTYLFSAHVPWIRCYDLPSL